MGLSGVCTGTTPHCALGKTRQRDPHIGHSAADYVTGGASDCVERIVPPES